VTAGAPDAGGEERPGEALRAFGRYLLRERELRGLSREDVAQFTKLAPAVIAALESGEPERIPPRAYLFGYLRSYAAAVGLDADDVVLRYQEAADPEGAGGGDGKGAERPRGPGGARRRWVVAAALALLAALAIAAGLLRPRGSGEIHGRRSPERAHYRAPAP